MSGFKDEKHLWKWQSTRLIGKWDRYELTTPAGHPDVKGSTNFVIHYIENKVGDYTTPKQRRRAMEPSQITYLDWLTACGESVWVCFGSAKEKTVEFFAWPDLNDTCRPDFWRG